jgi:hypothetical protein
MEVKSLVMNIDQSDKCANDYLELQAGNADPVKKCGSTAIPLTKIGTKTDNYTVTFVSNEDKKAGKGFKLEFKPSLRNLPEGM